MDIHHEIEWIFSGAGISGITLATRFYIKTSLRRKKMRILIVDRDLNSGVYSLLMNAGWKKTQQQPDLVNLDTKDVSDAHVIFINAKGVGTNMFVDHEGVKLARALKRKYPEKKVVVYAHEGPVVPDQQGMIGVNAYLLKGAQPYEFIKLVEVFADELFKAK